MAAIMRWKSTHATAGEKIVTAALEALIEKARTLKMTEAQLREQRISFVYGNTHIENDRITREMVIEADAKVTNELRDADVDQAGGT